MRRFAFARLHAFPIIGWGGRERWWSLLATAPITLSRAPHDTDLLVLAGEIPQSWGEPLAALLETVSLPRAVLWLSPEWECPLPPSLPGGSIIRPEWLDEIDWPDITQRLLNPDHPVQHALLPDKPPSPWRGRGDYGQGGEGMMGGKPYGRPMAMTMEDRDNMTLDDVATALGPYFPGLPSGLQLNLKVQGDCIRTCQDMTNTFPHRQLTPTLIRYGEPVLRTLGGEAITVQLLERERLRNHLGWMADFLEFAGLNALAQRLRRHRNSTDPDLVNGLLNRIDGFALRRLTQGIGVITHDQAQRLNLVGPVARASGVATDTRSLDSAYQALKFTPQVETAGDVWARWRVRVRECRQSLALLHQAGDTLTLAREGARGCYARNSAGGLDTPTKANLAAVKPNLAGLEWFEAILFLTSLDLDMTEAALG